MERAQAEIVAALFLQLHIPRNDIHDIVSRSHFLHDLFRIIHELQPPFPYLIVFHSFVFYAFHDCGTNSSSNLQIA